MPAGNGCEGEDDAGICLHRTVERGEVESHQYADGQKTTGTDLLHAGQDTADQSLPDQRGMVARGPAGLWLCTTGKAGEGGTEADDRDVCAQKKTTYLSVRAARPAVGSPGERLGFHPFSGRGGGAFCPGVHQGGQGEARAAGGDGGAVQAGVVGGMGGASAAFHHECPDGRGQGGPAGLCGAGERAGEQHRQVLISNDLEASLFKIIRIVCVYQAVSRYLSSSV